MRTLARSAATADVDTRRAVAVWVSHQGHPVYRLCDGHLRVGVPPLQRGISVAELVEPDGRQRLTVCGPADALVVYDGTGAPDRPLTCSALHPLSDDQTRLLDFAGPLPQRRPLARLLGWLR